MFVISQKCTEDFRQTEMLGRVQVRVQHVKIYAIHELCRGISTHVYKNTQRERGKWKAQHRDPQTLNGVGVKGLVGERRRKSLL